VAEGSEDGVHTIERSRMCFFLFSYLRQKGKKKKKNYSNVWSWVLLFLCWLGDLVGRLPPAFLSLIESRGVDGLTRPAGFVAFTQASRFDVLESHRRSIVETLSDGEVHLLYGF